jgi:hypothetical protein
MAPATGGDSSQGQVAALQQLSVQLGNHVQATNDSTAQLTNQLNALTQATSAPQAYQPSATASTATAGTGAAPPATVDQYMIVNIPGVGLRKIPLFLE